LELDVFVRHRLHIEANGWGWGAVRARRQPLAQHRLRHRSAAEQLQAQDHASRAPHVGGNAVHDACRRHTNTTIAEAA
jgi:hypothetical protein